LILVFHSYAMRSFGVPILPDTVINFIAMTVTTAGTAMIFGRYRRGVSDTFARLQVAEAQSMTDALTALPNRRKFRLDSASRVIGSRPHCLIVLDLDEFKRVNDSLGHQAGDHILKAFGDAVADQLPDAATLYRWAAKSLRFWPSCSAPTRRSSPSRCADISKRWCYRWMCTSPRASA